MAKQYLGYFNSSSTRNSRKKVIEESDDDSSFSDFSEGLIHTPLETTSKNPGLLTQKIIKDQALNNLELQQKKIKVIVPPKTNKQIAHIRKGSYSPVRTNNEFKKDTSFLEEMSKHGIDKDINKLWNQNSFLRSSPRNCQLDIYSTRNESIQSTTNTQNSVNINRQFVIFPYQRRNRSCSPEEKKIPKPIEINSNGPIIAKDFILGKQVNSIYRTKTKEGIQVLKVIAVNKMKGQENNEEQINHKEKENIEEDTKIKLGNINGRRNRNKLMRHALSKIVLENNEVFSGNLNSIYNK